MESRWTISVAHRVPFPQNSHVSLGQVVMVSKPEVIRLENQHRLCYTILGDHLYLPNVEIKEDAKILDLGTSSGIWAIEMATKFPHATVIGVDISPQQTGQPIPPNCTLQVFPSYAIIRSLNSSL